MRRKSISQKDSPFKRKSLSGSFQQKDLWKFVFFIPIFFFYITNFFLKDLYDPKSEEKKEKFMPASSFYLVSRNKCFHISILF